MQKYSHEFIEGAFRLFATENISIKKTAEALNIPFNTVNKWANKYKWTQRKREIMEQAQDTIGTIVAVDKVNLDLEIKERLCKMLFNDFDEIDDLYNQIQQLKELPAEDDKAQKMKDARISDLRYQRKIEKEGMDRILNRVMQRYLPSNVNSEDKDIQITISSNGRSINFLGEDHEENS